MQIRKRHIPLFMSVNNDTLPYLAVTLKSLSEHLNDETVVNVRILTSGLATYNQRKLRHIKIDNVDITIVDVNSRLEDYRADFEERLGSFYGEECFYPFFIAEMYPRLARAIYLECGTLVRDDIEKIYQSELGDNFIGGMRSEDELDAKFNLYREMWVGVDPNGYIDSSVMIMNLSLLRRHRIVNRFVRLLTGYNFDTVSAASDYINFLCKGRTVVLNEEWRTSDGSNGIAFFAPYRRPWHYVGTRYADEFWDTARRTPFYDDVRSAYFAFNEEEKEREEKVLQKVFIHADELAKSSGGFYQVLGDNYLVE